MACQKMLLQGQLEMAWILWVLHYGEALLVRAEWLLTVKLAKEYFLVHQFGLVGVPVACMVAIEHGAAEVQREAWKDFARAD